MGACEEIFGESAVGLVLTDEATPAAGGPATTELPDPDVAAPAADDATGATFTAAAITAGAPAGAICPKFRTTAL